MLPSTKSSTCRRNWSSVNVRWNLFLRPWTVAAPPLRKHGSWEPTEKKSMKAIEICGLTRERAYERPVREFYYLPDNIISTRLTIFSMCFRAAIKPWRMRLLNSSNSLDWLPPITSTNSGVSLNGLVSKPRFRGEVDRINPKSMWIRWPSLCNKILPLWRSFTWMR